MDACRFENRCDDCPERLVCRCLGITESALIEALRSGDLQTVKDIRRQTGAGDGCTGCHRLLHQYLERFAQAPSSALPICSAR
jgi:bacterioferritin-associated ferredoxin